MQATVEHEGHRRERRSNISRALRKDLGSIDDSIAKELLKEYGSWSRRIAENWHDQLRRRPGFFHVDVEDLIAVGNAALLEAWVIYRDGDVSRDNREGRTFGGGFSAHIRRTVYWRIRDYIEGHCHNDFAAWQRFDAHNGALAAVPASELDAEEQMENHELRLWLRGALATLGIRERAIVAGVMRGDSQAELGRALGLTRFAVHRAYHGAIVKLRQYAMEHGLDVDIAAPLEDDEHE